MKAPTTPKPPKSRAASKAAGRPAAAEASDLSTEPGPSFAASKPEADPGKPARRPPLSGKKAPAIEPLAGSVQEHGGWYTLRVRVDGRQPRIKLGKVGEMSRSKAEEKAAAWLERMARENRGGATSTRTTTGTFQNIGERWTSGELTRTYPDHVKPKTTSGRDAERLVAHVYPLVGNKLVVNFELDDAERVMQALPRKTVRTPATRRHYAQLMHRILGLAVYPLKLIKVSPLPKGWLPKLGPAKAKGWLYPDEDAELCGTADVPLCWRLFYGFLNREGPRLSEAAALDLSDVDVGRGAVKLDENKTNDPRAWALGADVVRALRASIALRESAAGAPLPRSAPLFVDDDGERIRADDFQAKRFRAHLKAARIDREELFERSASRMHIRLHDTRATFVTPVPRQREDRDVGSGSNRAQVERHDQQVQACSEDGRRAGIGAPSPAGRGDPRADGSHARWCAITRS